MSDTPGSENRRRRKMLGFRINPAEGDILMRAAKRAKVPMAQFLREAALAKAKAGSA